MTGCNGIDSEVRFMEQMDVKQIQAEWNKRKWWEKVVIGVVAIIFGIVAFAWPDMTLYTITMLFGAFALVIGIFAIVSGIAGKDLGNARTIFIIQGILGIIIGLIVMTWPGLSLLFVAYLIGFWAIMYGVFEIVAAAAAPPDAIPSGMSKGILALSGIISLIFGFIIVLFPGEGVLAILWIIAAFAIILGIVNVVIGFQDRKSPKAA
ncbi:MAG: HdeD family acid-resistance protein [Methanomassiliicoccales archaeon]|nr:HdeD family acid-resistance protein [Methanomassiliicoccales archaeon]